MISKKLLNFKSKKQYKIYFKDYSILIFHPVTTEVDKVSKQTNLLIYSLIESNKNYAYPNNDLGSNIIIKTIEKLKNNKKFKILKTMRLTYFLLR